MDWYQHTGLFLSDFLYNEFQLEEIQAGVWRSQWGRRRIRIIVARELPEVPRNSTLHLFSAQLERVQYAVRNYQQHSAQTSSLIRRLLEQLDREGIIMSTTTEELLQEMTERFNRKFIEGLRPEEWQQITQKVPPKDILKGLITKGLTVEELREYLKELEEGTPTSDTRDDSTSSS